jgi:hypothetical protein
MATDNAGGAQRWEVVDTRTGKVIGAYASAKRARRKVDELDNEYGGYRYTVRPVSDSRKAASQLSRRHPNKNYYMQKLMERAIQRVSERMEASAEPKPNTQD